MSLFGASETVQSSSTNTGAARSGEIEDAHFVLSPSGFITVWPAAAEMLTSFSAAFALNKHLDLIFASTDHVSKPSRRLLETACTCGMAQEEGWNGRKDGSSYRASLHLTAIRDEEGRIAAIAAHLRNLSFHQKSKELSWLLNLLVSTVKDYAIFMLDPNGLILTWNTGAQRMKLYTKEEIVGRHFSILYTADDIAIGKPGSLLRIAMECGSATCEGWRMRKDGTIFWASVVITALIHPESKALLGFAKVVRDLTERQLAEKQLVESFAESSRRQAEFLASVSHEVRTPLSGVVGMSELLASTSLDETQRGYVHWLRRSAMDLIALISDILDTSKIEAGKLELDRRPFVLRELLNDMLEYGLACLGQKMAVQFRPQIDGVPMDLCILGDRGRLRQIITNLLSNASKFTNSGSISLIAEIVNKDTDSVVVHFGVTDTGIGISEEDQTRLFLPYSQIRTAQQASFHGTGLGLTIAKSPAQLMQGDISLKSIAGQGTVFTFDLQFQKVKSEASVSEQIEVKFAGHALVVDDNELNRIIASRILELLGCTAVAVDGGITAIEEVQRGHFDIILSKEKIDAFRLIVG